MDGFPNMFVVMGPNSIVGTGPFIEAIEAGVGYVVKAVAKTQRERLKSIEVRKEALRDFDELIQVWSTLAFVCMCAAGVYQEGMSSMARDHASETAGDRDVASLRSLHAKSVQLLYVLSPSYALSFKCYG